VPTRVLRKKWCSGISMADKTGSPLRRGAPDRAGSDRKAMRPNNFIFSLRTRVFVASVGVLVMMLEI
jgi:hypothetical protein